MNSAGPSAPIKAGLAYWAVIFALGFVLGTVRTFWGAEAMGEGAFILIEIPVILLASWFAARWLTRRFAVRKAADALLMGASAFVLLMAAELALTASIALSQPGTGAAQAMREWLTGSLRPPGVYGLLGQAAFALLPLAAVKLPPKR